MLPKVGTCLPLVMHAVHVGYRDLRELFLRDAFQAADVDTVHRADRRVHANTEDAHAAMLAKEMMVLLRAEQVLCELTSPDRRRKPSGRAMAAQKRLRRQMEQLQR